MMVYSRLSRVGKEAADQKGRTQKVDDTSATAATEVAYENIADEAWARQAFDLYRRRQLQVQAFDTEGVVSAQVWGTCPRCSHELNMQVTLSTPIAGLRQGRSLWTALTRRDIPTAPGIPDSVEVACGCEHAHPGAPSQITGCGVSFRLPTTSPDMPDTS
jgi:hypothetical protein